MFQDPGLVINVVPPDDEKVSSKALSHKQSLTDLKRSVITEFGLNPKSQFYFLTLNFNKELRALVDTTDKGKTKIVHAAIKYGYFKTTPGEDILSGISKPKFLEGYIPVQLIYQDGKPSRLGLGLAGKFPLKELSVEESRNLPEGEWTKLMRSALNNSSVPATLYRHVNEVCVKGICYSKK